MEGGRKGGRVRLVVVSGGEEVEEGGKKHYFKLKSVAGS